MTGCTTAMSTLSTTCFHAGAPPSNYLLTQVQLSDDAMGRESCSKTWTTDSKTSTIRHEQHITHLISIDKCDKSNGNAMINSLHLLQWLSDLATPRADGPERVKVGPTGSYRGKAPDFARGEESRMCGSTLISYQWKVLMRMTCTIFRHGPRGSQ